MCCVSGRVRCTNGQDQAPRRGANGTNMAFLTVFYVNRSARRVPSARWREAAAKTKLFKLIGNKATRRRLGTARSRTSCAAEDLHRLPAILPSAPSSVPRAPCAAGICFFNEHTPKTDRRAEARFNNTQFAARLESSLAHRREGAAPAPSRTHAAAHRLMCIKGTSFL